MKALIGRYFGQYRIKEILGTGGMGTVYKAYEEELDRFVAIKVLHPSLSRDSQFVQRFVREARLLASLSHPNLIHVYSIGKTDDDYHFFAMEYIKGMTLDEYIKQNHPISLEKAWHLCGQTLSALWAIHKAGLVHRDVKPSNIMLASDDRAVLMDFGLTKDPDQPGVTREGIIAGTPEYMSPEQARGDNLDGRSDLYSLGIMMFEIFTSYVPFSGNSAIQILRKHCEKPLPDISEKRPDLPESAAFVIRMATAKELPARFFDAPDMAEAMHKVQPTSELLEVSRSSKILKSTTDLTRESLLKETILVDSDSAPTSVGDSQLTTSNLESSKKNWIVRTIVIAIVLAVLVIVGIFAIKGKDTKNSQFTAPIFIKDKAGTKIVANPICEFFMEDNSTILGRFISYSNGEVIAIPRKEKEPRKLEGVMRIRILSQEQRKKLESMGQIPN